MKDLVKVISDRIGIEYVKVRTVLDLLEEGNTIPFIARYRKEMTGGLDEVELFNIEKEFDFVKKLEDRKVFIIDKLGKSDKLTDELRNRIDKVDSINELESLYDGFKEKRSKKADLAREKGLGVVADQIIEGLGSVRTGEKVRGNKRKKGSVVSVTNLINQVITERDDLTREEVVEGVKELVKESVIEDVGVRDVVRDEYIKRSYLVSKATKKASELDKDGTFKMYYEYREEYQSILPHRLLAIKRGERLGILKVSYEIEKERLLDGMVKTYAGDVSQFSEDATEFVMDVVKESFNKSLKGSVEREVTNVLTEKSENGALTVFAKNVEDLLMTPPVRIGKALGFDPAYRTGCKLAVVDELGKFETTSVIYPHAPRMDREGSFKELDRLYKSYDFKVVVIGNGTASRESEEFIAEWIRDRKLSGNVSYLIVSEAGASVYSASLIAREEFPNLKVEERSAVSIARRVLDPLAELIKIDTKSLGVGQYQHDIDQNSLDRTLDFVVEKVVNRVGVDVNTASVSLLSRVSGLSEKMAKSIVDYRETKGYFTNRKQIMKVKGIGKKAYEQSIGFLRVYDGEEFLDSTGVHPDDYAIARELMKKGKITTSKFNTLSDDELANELNGVRDKIAKGTEASVVDRVIEELVYSRRDVRDSVGEVVLRKDVLTIEDLKIGMELRGTVRNVVDFGAFVDIGLKNDGLVHISKLSNRFVKHPSDVVSIGDVLNVRVDTIDEERGKIGLSVITS